MYVIVHNKNSIILITVMIKIIIKIKFNLSFEVAQKSERLKKNIQFI